MHWELFIACMVFAGIALIVYIKKKQEERRYGYVRSYNTRPNFLNVVYWVVMAGLTGWLGLWFYLAVSAVYIAPCLVLYIWLYRTPLKHKKPNAHIKNNEQDNVPPEDALLLKYMDTARIFAKNLNLEEQYYIKEVLILKDFTEYLKRAFVFCAEEINLYIASIATYHLLEIQQIIVAEIQKQTVDSSRPFDSIKDYAIVLIKKRFETDGGVSQSVFIDDLLPLVAKYAFNGIGKGDRN